MDSIVKIIQEMKRKAKQDGKSFIEITAKDIHDIVGKYPNGNTRYPSCCRAMYKVMANDDIILNTTKSSFSSTIKIKYFL